MTPLRNKTDEVLIYVDHFIYMNIHYTDVDKCKVSLGRWSVLVNSNLCLMSSCYFITDEPVAAQLTNREHPSFHADVLFLNRSLQNHHFTQRLISVIASSVWRKVGRRSSVWSYLDESRNIFILQENPVGLTQPLDSFSVLLFFCFFAV